MAYRDHTKVIRIGDRMIGGGNPILIQSMTNTKTEDVAADSGADSRVWRQAGCEIIRCAVPTMEAAQALKEIKKQIHIPLVADIHFDYRLAIAAIENGADKIRINPGNIGVQRACAGSSREGERVQCADPSGRQQWFSGEKSAGKIRWCDGRGNLWRVRWIKYA